MKKKFFGAVVAPISIVGLTFALGLGTTAFGVGEQQQSQSDSEISALDVTTEVPVAPWCGWYVSTANQDDIALVPAEAEPETYTGEEITLTATGALNTAYVGKESGLEAAGAAEDCSWFDNTNKYGARYDVVADGADFTAEALLPSPVGATADGGMDFSASESNALKIENVGIEGCSAEFITLPGAELRAGAETLRTTPWTVAEASVTNNNFCQWSAKYEIKIPGGKSPLYGNVTYRWTGPQLTHTLIIPEDQTGDDTP